MIARRVLFLDHTAQLGGGEIALVNLVAHLDTSRFDPAVVLFSDGPLRDRLEADGVRVLRVPLSATVVEARKDSLGWRTLLRPGAVRAAIVHVRNLARLMRDERAELIHTNSLKADILGGIAGRLAGVPVVWHVRDRIANDYLPRPVAAAFRMLCRLIPAQIIANSQATLSTLGEGLVSGAVVVHSGVSIIHDGTLVAADAASTGSVTSNVSPVIGLVARLAPWKGQHIFLDAAARVKTRFPAARFQIIGAALFGEDGYERQLREQVEQLGLCDSVEFLGFCDDVSERIARMDLLVHASTTGEPFGQVIIEGMAAGKPVVATDGGGVPEIVVDGVTGLLVPMDNAPALADAMCAILEDPQRARAMGIAALVRVRERFTAQHTADRVMAVFDEVLARSGRGRSSMQNRPASAAPALIETSIAP